jgi:hypothetical protein
VAEIILLMYFSSALLWVLWKKRKKNLCFQGGRLDRNGKGDGKLCEAPSRTGRRTRTTRQSEKSGPVSWRREAGDKFSKLMLGLGATKSTFRIFGV